MNKKIIASAATLSGTIIGAGVLGLPYVFAQAGFLLGWMWIVFFGIIMLVTYLYIMESYLRTPGHHQLPGLAEIYLGKKGKYIMLIAMIFGVYASLAAYLLGEGKSLSLLFFQTEQYAIYLSILFWLILSVLLEGGIERLKKIESYGLVAIIIIIAGIFIFFFNRIQITNLTYIDTSNLFLPLGVTLFALLGFSSLPEVRDEMRGSEKYLKKTLFLGVLIPVILYLVFSATFVGVLGNKVTEIATLSFGPFIILLGIFTMLTSYFALSYSIKDVCIYDLKLHHRKTFIITAIMPLLIFIILHLFHVDSFTTIIGIGGVISGGITAILCLIINFQSKIYGKRHPEFSVPINIPVMITIITIFLIGVILQIIP